MPTYYTSEPGSFEEFKEKCLTAFKLHDQTEYLEDRLAEARGELCRLIHLDDGDLFHEEIFFKLEEETRVRSQTVDMSALRNKYEDLLRQAREWPGPEEVREFMINQLECSIKYDIYEPQPARKYSYEDALDNALSNFKFYHESYTKHCVALDKYEDLITRSQV